MSYISHSNTEVYTWLFYINSIHMKRGKNNSLKKLYHRPNDYRSEWLWASGSLWVDIIMLDRRPIYQLKDSEHLLLFVKCYSRTGNVWHFKINNLKYLGPDLNWIKSKQIFSNLHFKFASSTSSIYIYICMCVQIHLWVDFNKYLKC